MQQPNIQCATRYDKYLVQFSGGKDSVACFLHLLEIGVPLEKIELWHNEVDADGPAFMDWECTTGYCRAFAAHFGVPIFFSYKKGGFFREMTRDKSLTAPIHFQTPDGVMVTGGVSGKESTRMKFPQVSADLSVRWCSAYLKIDVSSAAVRGQARFAGKNTCVVSGERAEESKARSRYMILEPDRADSKSRYVDRWRPVHGWCEAEVWDIIRRWKVRVHPCYYMGWSRCSCKFCIFGNADQFASAAKVSPVIATTMCSLEDSFGHTMKRGVSLRSLMAKGSPYGEITNDLILVATSRKYELPITMEDWFLPAGAFREGCGPS